MPGVEVVYQFDECQRLIFDIHKLKSVTTDIAWYRPWQMAELTAFMRDDTLKRPVRCPTPSNVSPIFRVPNARVCLFAMIETEESKGGCQQCQTAHYRHSSTITPI